MRLTKFCLYTFIAILGLWASHCFAAVEFKSVSENAAVLYDAPSVKAKKRFILTKGYPVEVVVNLGAWTKVRDASGVLSWVETKSLTDKRTVLVKVRTADVRQTPDENAPIVFRVEQDVILDLTEFTGSGWIRVQHKDGNSGYIRAVQVWGE